MRGCQLHRKVLSSRSRIRRGVEAGPKECRTEFYSAVQRRLREKHLSSRDAAAVWKQFEEDERSGLWHWLPVTESVVRRACNAFEKLDATAFLRASDALHLACAVENQFAAIYSADRILLEAAPNFGLKGISVY